MRIIGNLTFLFIFTWAFVIGANAQQTIFNVPSSDVLDKGKIYGELDVSFKTNRQDALGKFSSFVPRVVVGAGGNVEVGLNITGNINPGTDSTTISPTVKWRVYNGEKNGVQIVAVDNLFIPVRSKSYNAGNYSYAQVSKTFQSKTRLMGGGYYFTKNVVSTAERAGGQFGFEQTVNKYLNINADWFTGRNSAGYFTPGIAFKPHPKITGYVGYSIGDADARRGNNFFLLELGYNFN